MELSDVVAELKEFEYQLVEGNGKEELYWVTPSGFPVEYKKRMMCKTGTRGTISGYGRIGHVINLPTENADTRGFMTGIAPNFIHSLDASHLALTVADWEGSFGAVHDSFSTHASEVDDLLALTKQVFIDMYDEDNYFDVIRHHITGNTDDVKQPDVGDLDIGGVNDSEYFFL